MSLGSWQEALDYLYHRANWEAAPPGTGPELKLGRVRALLADLGHPHDAWRSVHIGGTNGKGSTSALVAAGLGAAGYRVGLFTSPHMHTVRERVQVDGQPISEEAVLGWLNRHQSLLESHAGLTTFEALVALAFSHFAASKVDIAVIEVGLGGMLDATNVLDNQRISAITPIGLDHTEILGSTVELIAADKAGIFRPGVPVVIAPQLPGAEAVLRERASVVGSPLIAVGHDVRYQVLQDDLDGQELSITVNPSAERLATDSTSAATYQVHTRLLGRHQQANVATAVAILHCLNDTGLAVPPRAIREGIAAARWPGRLEVFPLDGGGHLILDGAHNPAGAAALNAALDHYFPQARRHLVLGIGGGKDAQGIIQALIPGASRILTARSDHPKALKAEAVAERVAAAQSTLGLSDPVPVIACASVAAALDLALTDAATDDLIVCAGSIFLVADAREAWFRLRGWPLPPHDPPMG